ncbi:FAD-dependent oxidoreductase [Halogranum amylolyticum]|nr:FAD-dependent monooxygenase [Halogranum amylolyticum]
MPEYDSTRLERVGSHAVVIGASMAGLCAARVLTDGFEEVTIVERDSLPDVPAPRRGVPQAQQPHVLWEAGRATLEHLFPGYSAAVLEAGGVKVDGQTEFNNYSNGDFLANGDRSFAIYSATRPVYEQIVRERVVALGRIRLRSECQFTGYLLDDTETTVEGIEIRTEDSDSEQVRADLVVDATGRTSRTPALLEYHGYQPPALDEVQIDAAYSTTFIQRPADDHRAFGALAEAPRTRGGVVAPVEENRWLVSLHGVHGDHPPTDYDDFVDFAASVPATEIRELLEEHPPVDGEIHHYPFAANRRYHYERLSRFPEGLVVVGDAVASFNPIYGQGMSVAALEAVLLHDVLATGGRVDAGLRFFDRTMELVDIAWTMAVGADFGFPETRGQKPRGTTFFNWYLNRLLRTAHSDGALTDAFVQVLMLERPPTTLLRPSVVWRVLKPSGGVRQALHRQVEGTVRR